MTIVGRPITIIWLLLILYEVKTQRIRLDNGQWGPQRERCPSSSRCERPQYCSAFRNREDWRRTAQQCGRRRPQMYCCPNEFEMVRRPLDNMPSAPAREQSRPTANRGCGTSILPSSRSGYVIGGGEAKPGQFPWVAAILERQNRKSSEKIVCTGFLIDMQHVLSAAHCFPKRRGSVKPNLYAVRIGNIEWRKGERYDISDIRIPSTYRQFYDDIAVMKLERPVSNPNVLPICLPPASMVRRNLTGSGTTVAGWGVTRVGGQMNDRLMYLEAIPVLSNANCQRTLGSMLSQGVPRTLLCAGFLEGGRDSCEGDSGGPLMYFNNGRWYAVGVVSFGLTECAAAGYPAGYTRITEFLDFIRQNTS